MRYLYFLSILFFINLNVIGQEKDTLTLAKGRMFTSLYGTLSNQQVDVGSGEKLISIGYTIGTMSGAFIQDNWILGMNFSLSKSAFSGDEAKLDNEELLIGPWVRYYFGQRGDAALYAEITPNYTSVFRKSTLRNIGGTVIVLDEEVTGGGFGIIPGIGFTYLINRNVGFGMTLSYSLAWLNVESKDLLLNSVESNAYNVSKFQFEFNFQIYLDQFFF